MLTDTFKHASRLTQLNPFVEPKPAAGSAPKPEPESGYGCVEWFHYLGDPELPSRCGGTVRRRHWGRRP